MRLKISLVILLCLAQVVLYSQKPELDDEALKKWYGVSNGIINNDGSFVAYKIFNQPEGSETLVIQSTKSNWKKVYEGASQAVFTNSNSSIVFKWRDSLYLLDMKKDKLRAIHAIQEFSLIGDDFIVYRKRLDAEMIHIRKLGTEDEKQYDKVINYSFSGNNELLIQVKQNDINQTGILNLESGSLKKIWESKAGSPQNFSWDKSGEQLTFLVEKDEGGSKKYEVWFYKTGFDVAKKIAGDGSKMDGEMVITKSYPRFTNNGKFIISLLATETLRKKEAVQGVDIWSYNDTILQSEQLAQVKRSITSAAALNVETGKMIQIEKSGERIISESSDFAIIEKKAGEQSVFESFWNKAAQFSYYIVSFSDGLKRPLKEHIDKASFNLSPSGKWIVYYDFQKKSYFSYEVSTGRTLDISKRIKVNWEDEENEYPMPEVCGIAAWMPDDKGVFIYDSYDIWLADPSGNKEPLNWTNGYGRRKGIKFNFLDNQQELDRQFLPGGGNQIILKAFDKNTKNGGRYRKEINKPGDPTLLSMGARGYGNWDIFFMYNFPAVKAKNGSMYLDVLYSATRAPNYFVTKDYKTIKFLSDVQPQKNYNWYTTELHKWKSAEGREHKGILYKPENFDPHKKYPVIFDYYEQRSDELNLFPSPPILSAGRISIPLFVSSGYLVFVPDIHYTIGETGKNVHDAVVSAAKYLSQYSWINAKRMGLQGHSFGGFETGYIVTHTDIFAAACAAAGIYDLMSSYGSLTRGTYQMYHSEKNQGKLGATPWEIPAAYIQNSSIYYAHKITTPVLLMHNKEDRVVSFAQGVEFYMAMRRLGKRSWMLQYDNEEHYLSPFSEASKDYHKRMMQFFDHYLRDSAAPKWMMHGIAAKMKGIDDGLELVREKDPKTGKWITPPEGGLLTDEEKRKVDALKYRKPVNIVIE